MVRFKHLCSGFPGLAQVQLAPFFTSPPKRGLLDVVLTVKLLLTSLNLPSSAVATKLWLLWF